MVQRPEYISSSLELRLNFLGRDFWWWVLEGRFFSVESFRLRYFMKTSSNVRSDNSERFKSFIKLFSAQKKIKNSSCIKL